MSRTTKRNDKPWRRKWSNPGQGRYLKRRLSKARRWFAKQSLRGNDKAKASTKHEKEVNNRGH